MIAVMPAAGEELRELRKSICVIHTDTKHTSARCWGRVDVVDFWVLFVPKIQSALLPAAG